MYIENLQILNHEVFDSDAALMKELIKAPKNDPAKPERIGIVLLSPIKQCLLCGSKLYIRPDRSVLATVYDHHFGSVPAIHYTRYCRKKGCSLQQHYGYHTKGDPNCVTYDEIALELPYFMCSRETGFSIEILKKFDAECLIGQISYKQSADIYNHYNGYECIEDK